MPESIRIRASDLAKFIGRNPYVSKEEATELFWERNARLAEKYGIAVDVADPMAKKIKTCTNAERTAIATHFSLPSDSSVDVLASTLTEKVVQDVARTSTTAAADEALAKLPAAVAPVASVVAQESQKMRGVLREQASIRQTESETGRKVGARNEEYFQKTLFHIDGMAVLLGGMIDGAFEEEKEIVEIKERRNRLFNRINSYEIVQLHSYMHLTDMKTATLVERWNAQSASHKTEFDASFWKTCVDELEVFLKDCLRR